MYAAQGILNENLLRNNSVEVVDEFGVIHSCELVFCVRMRIMCGKILNKKSGHKILKTLRFMVVFSENYELSPNTADEPATA